MKRIKNKPTNLRQNNVVDNLHTENSNLPLSARMGAELEKKIQGMVRMGEPVAPEASTVTLKMATQPLTSDSINVGGEVYWFYLADDDQPDDEAVVIIGEDVEDTQTALLAALGDSELVDAGTWAEDELVLTAKIAGVSGDLITVESDLQGEDGFDTETLEGGVDGTVAKAGTFMITASDLYIAVDDCTVSEGNWKSIELED